MRQFATTEDLTAWYAAGSGDTPVNSPEHLLRLASAHINRATRLAVYDIDDTTGMPTVTALIDALRDATCAQAEYLDDLGDLNGTDMSGFKSLSLGSFSGTKEDRGSVNPPAYQYAPLAREILVDAGLIGNSPVVL